MATGMQTGMRTGSAPLPTGARPGGAGGPGGPLGKVLQTYNSLSPKLRITIGAGMGLLLIVIIGFSFYTKKAKYVTLYDTKLSQTDVKQISMKLTEMKIRYELQEGGIGILVSPSERDRARIELASYGLPLRPLRVPDDGGMTPKTADDKKYERMQTLEADLTESIRQIEGVADAYVKIVQPEKDYFGDNTKQTTAAVMVRMQPSTLLAKAQIRGIVHLIAFSVEGLDPKNVEIVDTKGLRLTDPNDYPDENSPMITTQQMDKKVAFERQLQQKVQGMLDDVLGQNKARVVVNATLDFSTSETETFKVGGPTNTSGVVKEKEKLSSEFFTSSPDKVDSEGGTQMSYKGSKNSGEQAKYKKYDNTIIYKADQIKKKTVTPPGRVERITASVMVDNLKPDQVANVKAVVKDAIGIDETRGDSVTVASLPFNQNMFDAMRSDMMNRGATVPSKKATPFSASYLPYAAGAVMAILLIPVMVFMLRQRKVQTERSRLILATGTGATASDISDLISDKIGRSTAPPETQVNTTDQLEKLAKEKPTKVAELLKSTWLAEKER